MHDWFSILPPLVTLVMAISTKRIIPSLILGLIVGSTLAAPNLLSGFPKAAEYLANSLASPESAYVVIFLFMFGALTEFFKLSGGIKGFCPDSGKVCHHRERCAGFPVGGQLIHLHGLLFSCDCYGEPSLSR